MSYSTPNNDINSNYFSKLLNAPKQEIQKDIKKILSPCQLNFTNNNNNPIINVNNNEEKITPKVKKLKTNH